MHTSESGKNLDCVGIDHDPNDLLLNYNYNNNDYEVAILLETVLRYTVLTTCPTPPE